MAISAGSVYVGLGAKVDRSEFAAYDRELAKVRAKTAEREKYKAQLGADFDARAFNAYQRELNKTERQTREFDKTNKKTDAGVEALGKTMRSLFKDAGIITGIGLAAQGVSALGAAGVAATASLGPLAGALGAYPALGSAFAQAMGTVKLATSGMSDAVEAGIQAQDGSADSIKKYQEALKGLAPEAAGFVKQLVAQADKVGELKQEAGGLFGGASEGFSAALKNFPVLKKIVGETATTMGDLAEKAGRLAGSKGFGRDLAVQGERNAKWIGQLGGAAIPVANGLRNITLAAGPLTQHMVDLAVKGAGAFERFTATSRRNGNLQAFFRETADVMDRVLRITRDLGIGLINIFRGAYPLGRDFQISLERTAATFRKWTESAHGQNVIAKYFQDARGPSYELFKLIRDVGKVFFNLGAGNQVQPLLRQVRTQLLPAFATLVDSTTKAFGPAFLNALTQAIILFSRIAGSSGPLVEFTKLVGTILSGINKIIDRIPAIGTSLSAIIAIGGIYKALGIAASLSGIGKLIGGLKTARAVAAETSLAGSFTRGGAGGAAGSALGKTAGSGIAGGIAGAIASAPAAALTAAAAPAAITAYLALQEPAKNVAKTLRDVGKAAHAAFNTHDPKLIRLYANTLEEMKGSVGNADGALSALQRKLRGTAGALEEHRDKVRRVNRDVAHSFEVMKTVTEGNLGDIRRFTRRNAEDIKDALGKNTTEGRQALARNFRLAAQAVRDRMQETGKTTRAGTEEIRSLMTKALSSLGLTRTQAANIVDHGTVQSTSERVPGGGGGRRAVGGWVGQRGEAGGDNVPIMVGAGEAVLNRHQQAVVEGLLGDGFLDRLFTAVDRPHYLAKGGRAIARGIQRFQGGGIVAVPGFPGERAASSVIPKIEAIVHQFPGLILTDAYGQGHKSPGHTKYGTAADFDGPDRVMDRAVAALVRQGFLVGYDGRFGSQDWPGHGPSTRTSNHHFHVELGGGGAISAALPKIKAPRIGGRGAVTAMANRALGLTAAGANRQIERAAEASLSVPVSGGRSAPAGANVVSAFRRAARAAGATGMERLALFEAGIVESGLRNLDHGDEDSVGALQQRPSQGWHGLMNPYAAALEFLQHARGLRPFHGSAGMLAQAVQRSRYPGRYDAVAGQARRYLGRGGMVGAARGISSGAIRRISTRFSSLGNAKPKPRPRPRGSRYLPLPRGWGWEYGTDGKITDIYNPEADYGPATQRTINRLDLAAARATVDTPDDLGDDVKVAAFRREFFRGLYRTRVAHHAPGAKILAAARDLKSATDDTESVFQAWLAQTHPEAADPGGGGGSTTDASPDLQALLDQANTRLSGAQANLAAAGRVQQAFSSSGDIGRGGFANAWTAASRPNVIFQSYVPPSPQEALRLANYTVGGIGLQPSIPATRATVGV